jgi:2-iminobutanoate/2-iminopropanoate deaminase
VTGQLVEGGIEAQTRQVLQNLSHVLEAAGSSLRHVVKTTVFMKDIGEFAQMNTIYGEMFGEHKPARSTVQVAALPRGAAVEIECVAVVKE